MKTTETVRKVADEEYTDVVCLQVEALLRLADEYDMKRNLYCVEKGKSDEETGRNIYVGAMESWAFLINKGEAEAFLVGYLNGLQTARTKLGEINKLLENWK